MKRDADKLHYISVSRIKVMGTGQLKSLDVGEAFADHSLLGIHTTSFNSVTYVSQTSLCKV